MQFSECVRRLCGYHFEIISTQSSSLRLLPALTCFLINMLPSSSPGVVIEVKTFPILSGVLSRSSSLLLLPLCNSLCVSVVFVAVKFGSYKPNLPLSFQFLNERASSSLGVVIQGKTSPIFFEMVASSSSLLFLSLCSSMCVSVVCVAGNMASYTPNTPLFFHFPHVHASSSLGVVIQGKTSPIFSEMVASSSSFFFCLYAVLCVCQTFVWLAIWHHIHPIFHSLSTSHMIMLPHRWGLLYRVRHLQFFLGWLPLHLHSFFCLYAVL